MNYRKPSLSITFTLLALLAYPLLAGERPNVLLLLVDDLKPALGCQGDPLAKTPNIDRLAQRGIRFDLAYCNQAVCAPSRFTLMLGSRSTSTGLYGLGSHLRRTWPNAVTLPQHFAKHGYRTESLGKVYHIGHGNHGDPDSFSVPHFKEKVIEYVDSASKPEGKLTREEAMFQNQPAPPGGMNKLPRGAAFESPDVGDDAYADGRVAAETIRRLQAAKKRNKPFLIAAGFARPHLPFSAPKKYWDLHDPQKFELAANPDHPAGSPGVAHKRGGEIRNYFPVPDKGDPAQIDDALARKLIHGYYASTSYVDAQIGKVLDELERLGLAAETIVVLWGDHGFHLGDLGIWTKHTNYEQANRIPILISAPGVTRPGSSTRQLAESVDIFPTLAELAGLPAPKGPQPIDGVSLVPVLKDPEARVRDHAFHAYPKSKMGRAIRTERFRLVEWKRPGAPRESAEIELYDYEEDPLETKNLAPEKPTVVKRLRAILDRYPEAVGSDGKPVKTQVKAQTTPSPEIANRALRIVAEAKTRAGKMPRGVVLAQGGREQGYAIHFLPDGRPAFDVRVNGNATRIAGKEPASGQLRLEATLEAERMTLSLNGKEVARAKSPGLIPVQPKDALSIGQDLLSAAGDYEAPNPFNGTVLSNRVEASIAKAAMLTSWGEKVTAENAWREYPRPQLQRENWTNLNGLWSYAVTPKAQADAPAEWDGEILVPFAIESTLSGVGRRLTPDDALWYRRNFVAQPSVGKRTRLNFEAVDYQCTLWVNRKQIGEHTGGNLPFSFDITDALQPGENSLMLRVTDATDSAYQLHGKQVLEPRGIWYTPVSGIWQTVWLEDVPTVHIARLKITAGLDGVVKVDLTSGPTPNNPLAKVVASLDGKNVAEGASNSGLITLKIPKPQLWSPDSPTLYDLTITFGEDQVKSYIGLRETGIAKDKHGHLRFTLNGEPIFHWGTLDQGWWPDGLLTPPSDAAMKSDIEFLKAAGFNTVRKHIKVEPRRYYAHCDRLGILVYQDQVSSGGRKRGDGASSPAWTRLQPEPVDADWPAEAHAQYMAELKTMIRTLHNHPSIVQWVPFNEAWGQHRTVEVGNWLVEYDPTRQVNVASGGNFWPAGHVVDHHQYPHPGFPFALGAGERFDGFVKIVGEFGGHGFPVGGHLWDPGARNWGYGGLPKDKAEWVERYKTSIHMLNELRGQGIAGGIYTQTTDVEGEINGLITYDRKVVKISPADLAEISRPLFGPLPKSATYLPLSSPDWKFTTRKPGGEWFRPDYDDSGWRTGRAGFGSKGTPGIDVRTNWSQPEIWLRKTFGIERLPKGGQLRFRLYHDEDVVVYLNGSQVLSRKGFTTGVINIPLDSKARGLLKQGTNRIAIHVRQTHGGQGIDAGLEWSEKGNTQSAADSAERPNIVVFLSDDHTWRDSSVYGSSEIETPHMARLAKAGITFDQAFVASPSCAPSRAALLTGLYPANNGAEPNHSRPRADIRKLPAYLRELGYEVVSFGKVGHYAQTPEYGFDLARHFGYHEDIAIPKALEWLRQRDSDQPLCLFVGSNWPHVPWPNETEFDPAKLQIPPNHVDNPTTREWRAKYLAAVRKMDSELGQVYDLAREKLGDEVFFLHSSDHGAQWPFGKWNLYEDGIRTPLIVSWPGRIQPGARTDAMVSWIDILPTLVDAAGGQAPKGIDGRSFLPVLQGKADTHRDFILTTHSGDRNFNVYPIRAARSADGWKYIRNLRPDLRFNSHVTKNTGDSGYWDSWVEFAIESPVAQEIVRRYQQRPAEELYRVGDDPWEQNNLAAAPEQAGRVAELRKQVEAWMAATDDPQEIYGEPVKAAPPKSPNIVTVFIDDMGWSDLSCFGGDAVKTEHIDRLAAEGIRFTQFYVNSPICSPSRTALTTGQYPQRWRITSYLDNRKHNEKRGMAQWLDPAAPVLARELRKNGYATGHFGKWHMGGQRDVANAPPISDYGFERSLTNFEGMGAKLLPLTLTPKSEKPGRIWEGAVNLGEPVTWMQRSEITAGFVDAAMTFIDQAGAKGQPFFVNVWPDDVHSPFFPPVNRWGDGSKRALYHAVLDTMDEQLGRLFDRIRDDELLRDNTLIVFCSDNGHEPGAGSSDPLRGAKTWLYEGGIRSPLIVWGPGLLAKGTAGNINESAVFSAIDLNRSLYALTETPLPDEHELDGENVLPAMLGNTKTARQAPICFRRPPDRPGNDKTWGMGDNPDLAVRDGKWKYLVNYDGSAPQLYDLDADAAESNNLAAAQPQVVARLHKTLFDWNATLPPDAGDPDYARKTAAKTGTLADEQFVNPIAEGADPWVVRDPNADRYLWCFSDSNRAIAIHAGPRLTALGAKRIVWTAPDAGPVSREIWAPELHFLDGKWHIYFAASDGKNENHLAYVLVSAGAAPFGDYTLHGPLETGDRARTPIWAIDMTVLEREGKRYALWSGWDKPGSDRQFLYAAAMKSPTEIIPPRVRICDNDVFPWEFTLNAGRGRGLNEAPQVLKTERRTFVTYSCGASWKPTYKLGRLELTGRDPLDPKAWLKHGRPIFTSSDETYGVGHSCVVPSPDGSQLWHVYHAKRDRGDGWRRGIFVQPMDFGTQGFPRFFRPVAPGEPLDRPAGEAPLPALKLPFASTLDAAAAAPWSLYGHHQRIAFADDGLHLGLNPEEPINDYRSGEKVMLERAVPDDLRIEVSIDFPDGARSTDAGILFRATGPAIGYDAQRGYFVGLIPRTQLLIFGKMDGRAWKELARAETKIDPAQPQHLAVEARGPRITAFHNGKKLLEHQDASYARGRLGLRVVNTHAVFRKLQVK